MHTSNESFKMPLWDRFYSFWKKYWFKSEFISYHTFIEHSSSPCINVNSVPKKNSIISNVSMTWVWSGHHNTLFRHGVHDYDLWFDEWYQVENDRRSIRLYIQSNFNSLSLPLPFAQCKRTYWTNMKRNKLRLTQKLS